MAFYSVAPPPQNGLSNLTTALSLYDNFIGLGRQTREQQLQAAKDAQDHANQAAGNAQSEEGRRDTSFVTEQQARELANQAAQQGLDSNKLNLDAANRTAQVQKGLRDSFQAPQSLELPPVFGLDSIGKNIDETAGTAYMAGHKRAFNDLPEPLQLSQIQQFQKSSGGNGTPGELADAWDKQALPLSGTLPITPPVIKGSPTPQYPVSVAATAGQPPQAQFAPMDPVFARQIEMQTKKEDFLKSQRDAMTKNAPITSYIGNGEHPGIRQVKSQLDALVSNYRDPQTGVVDWSKVSPSEAFSLIFSEGKVNDPNAVIRQQEFENIANQVGLKDKAANLYRKVMDGQTVPPKLLENIYNTVNKKAEGARQDFFKNMTGVEEHANENPYYRVSADQLLDDPTLRQEYQDWKTNGGVSSPTASTSDAGATKPLKFASPEAAQAALANGSLSPSAPIYVPGPKGWVRYAQPTKPAAATALPNLPTGAAVLPPNIMNILGTALGQSGR